MLSPLSSSMSDAALPMTSSEPPINVGAGATYPESGVDVSDGYGYSQWQDWSPCTVTCGGK